MSKVNEACLAQVKQFLEQYIDEVDRSGLTEKSAKTYKLHVDQFVRWLDDDFIPGDRVQRRNSRRVSG